MGNTHSALRYNFYITKVSNLDIPLVPFIHTVISYNGIPIGETNPFIFKEILKTQDLVFEVLDLLQNKKFKITIPKRDNNDSTDPNKSQKLGINIIKLKEIPQVHKIQVIAVKETASTPLRMGDFILGIENEYSETDEELIFEIKSNQNSKIAVLRNNQIEILEVQGTDMGCEIGTGLLYQPKSSDEVYNKGYTSKIKRNYTDSNATERHVQEDIAIVSADDNKPQTQDNSNPVDENVKKDHDQNLNPSGESKGSYSVVFKNDKDVLGSDKVDKSESGIQDQTLDHKNRTDPTNNSINTTFSQTSNNEHQVKECSAAKSINEEPNSSNIDNTIAAVSNIDLKDNNVSNFPGNYQNFDIKQSTSVEESKNSDSLVVNPTSLESLIDSNKHLHSVVSQDFTPSGSVKSTESEISKMMNSVFFETEHKEQIPNNIQNTAKFTNNLFDNTVSILKEEDSLAQSDSQAGYKPKSIHNLNDNNVETNIDGSSFHEQKNDYERFSEGGRSMFGQEESFKKQINNNAKIEEQLNEHVQKQEDSLNEQIYHAETPVQSNMHVPEQDKPLDSYNNHMNEEEDNILPNNLNIGHAAAENINNLGQNEAIPVNDTSNSEYQHIEKSLNSAPVGVSDEKLDLPPSTESQFVKDIPQPAKAVPQSNRTPPSYMYRSPRDGRSKLLANDNISRIYQEAGLQTESQFFHGTAKPIDDKVNVIDSTFVDSKDVIAAENEMRIKDEKYEEMKQDAEIVDKVSAQVPNNALNTYLDESITKTFGNINQMFQESDDDTLPFETKKNTTEI